MKKITSSKQLFISVALIAGLVSTIICPAQNSSWTLKTPISTPRGFTSGTVVDDRIYMIGGFISDHSVTSSMEIYNPATDTWTIEIPLPNIWQGFFLGKAGKKMLAIGGSYRNPQNTKLPIVVSTVEEYEFY